MTMIDTADSRFAKAVAIADQAGQWLKCRTADGRKAYGVPSQRTPGLYYLTTQSSCTCEDAKCHASPICKHALAVRIHCARAAGTPMPESDVVDGLAQMVTDRHGPVLDMVREADGSIRWERHDHGDGHVTYLPRHTRPPATAADYDRIFSKFEGE
jgi:hypothetical protein